MDRTPDPTRRELRERADQLSTKLEHVSASWHRGDLPTADELYALVDELTEIRELLGRLAPRTGDSTAEPLTG